MFLVTVLRQSLCSSGGRRTKFLSDQHFTKCSATHLWIETHIHENTLFSFLLLNPSKNKHIKNYFQAIPADIQMQFGCNLKKKIFHFTQKKIHNLPTFVSLQTCRFLFSFSFVEHKQCFEECSFCSFPFNQSIEVIYSARLQYDKMLP